MTALRAAALISVALMWMGCPSGPSTDGGSGGGGGTTATGGGTTATGGGSATGGGTTQDAGTDAGTATAIAIPGTAPYETWTWIDVPGAKCANGSATGIAVNPHQGSTNVTIYFEGGGACWAGLLCDQGPYTTASNLTGFNGASIGTGGQNIARASFNRADLTNPFRNDTLIYVPYCTGDVHAGNNVATYDRADGGSFDIHHVGYANFGLELPILKATFPAPSRVVVTGSSAGGYGAAFNYGRIHAAWPGVQAYLVDDSGPPLYTAKDVNWYSAQDLQWNVSANVPSDCPECRVTINGAPNATGGLVNLFPYYVKDATFRGSLLSTARDETISGFFSIPPGQQVNTGCTDGGTCDFTGELNQLITGVIAPANATGPGQLHVYVYDDHFHTFLVSPQTFAVTQGGTSLKAFLDAQLSDAGTWADVRP